MPRNPRADQIGTGGRIKSESPGGCARNAQYSGSLSITCICETICRPRFSRKKIYFGLQFSAIPVTAAAANGRFVRLNRHFHVF